MMLQDNTHHIFLQLIVHFYSLEHSLHHYEVEYEYGVQQHLQCCTTQEDGLRHRGSTGGVTGGVKADVTSGYTALPA